MWNRNLQSIVMGLWAVPRRDVFLKRATRSSCTASSPEVLSSLSESFRTETTAEDVDIDIRRSRVLLELSRAVELFESETRSGCLGVRYMRESNMKFKREEPY